MNNFLKITSCTLALSAFSAAPALAEPKVVTSIKPIHSLVSGVMEGVGTPALLVDGNTSPHDYALKPSNAQALQEADIVFWVGESFEQFLETPMETIADKAKSVEFFELSGLELHDYRDDDDFKASHAEDDHAGHDHDKHDHDDHAKEAKADKHDHDHDHDDHAKEAKAEAHDHDHDHDEHAKGEEHDHGDHKDHAKAKDAKHDDEHEHAKKEDHDDHAEEGHGHGHQGHDHAGGKDGHLWLDTHNAEKIVTAVATELSEIDPANKAKYMANAEAMHEKLEAMEEALEEKLEPLEDVSYLVFHDAYQYFERQFHLTPAAAVTISPEVAPGAERISQLQETVRDTKARCVFSEPQFNPRVVSTVIEGTGANTAILDPLGSTLENGPQLYFDLINGMADSFTKCLSPTN